jgi:hypothetical protein
VGSARRRPGRAVQQKAWTHELRARYLQLYQRDARLRAVLISLYDQYCADHEADFVTVEPGIGRVRSDDYCNILEIADTVHGGWARGYIQALLSLARERGLARLGIGEFWTPRGAPITYGVDWLNRRCLEWGRIARSQGPVYSVGPGDAIPWPDVGEVVARNEIVRSTRDGTMAPPLIVERREPLIHVRLEDRWDPREEPIVNARARLVAQATASINAELERIAADAESRGYLFRDTAPKTDQHLGWLFEHVALGTTYPELAKRDLGASDLAQTIANEAARCARVIGLSLAPHPLPPTPPPFLRMLQEQYR